MPAIEQTYSAGAVCLALLNAALAAGWGANWLTGWPPMTAASAPTALGLADTNGSPGSSISGTETAAPPDARAPTSTAITTWIEP